MNGLFVYRHYDHNKRRKKLRKAQELAENDILALQETYGSQHDLDELAKIMPSRELFDSFYTSTAAGGTIIIVSAAPLRDSSAAHVEEIHQGRIGRVEIRLAEAALSVVAIHSDAALPLALAPLAPLCPQS